MPTPHENPSVTFLYSGDRIRPEARAAIEAPPEQEIVLRTNQTAKLYGFAAVSLAIGCLGAFYWFTKERPFTIADYLTSAVGFLFFWIAWLAFWAAVRGYPQLAILGHRIAYSLGPSRAKVYDLNLLGPAEVAVVRNRRARDSLSLAFRDRRDYEALDATGMMEPVAVDGARVRIPLDFLAGHDRRLADEIAEVVNARRALALAPLSLSDAEIDARNAAFVERRRWGWVWPVLAVGLIWLLGLLLRLSEQVTVG